MALIHNISREFVDTFFCLVVYLKGHMNRVFDAILFALIVLVPRGERLSVLTNNVS